MTLNPKNDIQINRFKLEEESESIAALLHSYDIEWNNAVARLEKLNTQVENAHDELKNLKMELSFRAKSELSEGGKPPSDKVCESWVYTTPEFKEKFAELKRLRDEKAEAVATEHLLKNYHFQLLEKARQIDILTKQWIAQYFTTDRTGGEKTSNPEKRIKDSENFTETMSRNLTRRKRNEDCL